MKTNGDRVLLKQHVLQAEYWRRRRRRRMPVTMVQPSYGGIAICCVLPVL